MLQIKMLPAGNGDCLLVTHSGRTHTVILVDGGYRKTHEDYLTPELKILAAKQQALDLVIATHIDTDHIEGILALFDDLVKKKDLPLVKEVWHNSLRNLSTGVLPRKPLSQTDTDLLYGIRADGYSPSKKSGSSEIATSHAHSLSSRIARTSIRWNQGNGSAPIVAPMKAQISPELSIQILGPTTNRLEKLFEWWIDQLRIRGVNGTPPTDDLIADVYEFLVSREKEEMSLAGEIGSRKDFDAGLREIYAPDRSVTNASSISAILQADGKQVLLLGDSVAEDTIASLNLLLAPGPMHFHAVKLAHHGSHRNTSPELLDLIDSPLFLVSTDGDTHNHPSIAVLRAIVDRPAPFSRTLAFNYRTAASDFMRSYTSKSGDPFQVIDGFNTSLVIHQ